MKKILLSFLCCMLAVIGMQAAELVYTLEPIKGSNNGYAANCDIEIGGITWNLTGNSQMIPWRMGGKNLTNVDRALYSKTPINEAVGKVVLTVGTVSGVTVNSAKLLVANNKDFTSATNYEFTFKASSDIDIPVNAPSGSYFKFVFNVTVSGSNNKYFQITRAKFYAPEGGETPDPVYVPEPTFTPADGATFDESLDVTINVEDGLTAYYSLTGEEGPYDEGNQVTINETTTVWAKAVDAEGNESDVVSATYTRNEPLPEGAITKNFVVSEQGYANAETITSVTITDGITVTFDKGNNTSNPPKYYSSGSAIRCYGGNIFRVNSQVGKIVKVVLTFGSSDGSNGITTDCGKFEEDTWTGNADIVTFSIDGTSGNRRIASIEVTYVPFTENIVEGYYYLELAPWADGTNAWYAMYLCNKNNYPETGEWVVGYHTLVNDVETVIYDYTGDNAYTHMIFCRMDYDKKYVANWDNVIEQTDIITFTPATTENYFAKYVIDNKALPDEGLNAAGHWSEFDPNIGTGIDRVEATAAIRYANGVVTAEGAIEVYNVSGMVVARGNESLDLRNLNAGVYIVRNGNNVRKVVR